jgi:hypothetical protein
MRVVHSRTPPLLTIYPPPTFNFLSSAARPLPTLPFSFFVSPSPLQHSTKVLHLVARPAAAFVADNLVRLVRFASQEFLISCLLRDCCIAHLIW